MGGTCGWTLPGDEGQRMRPSMRLDTRGDLDRWRARRGVEPIRRCVREQQFGGDEPDDRRGSNRGVRGQAAHGRQMRGVADGAGCTGRVLMPKRGARSEDQQRSQGNHECGEPDPLPQSLGRDPPTVQRSPHGRRA